MASDYSKTVRYSVVAMIAFIFIVGLGGAETVDGTGDRIGCSITKPRLLPEGVIERVNCSPMHGISIANIQGVLKLGESYE